MPSTETIPDITVRGGQINVPHSTKPTHPPRHQPDTPINKKFAPAKPKPKKRQTKTPVTPNAPPPTPGEPDNGPTPPS